MGDIYRSAIGVLIWLGHGTLHMSLLKEMLNKLRTPACGYRIFSEAEREEELYDRDGNWPVKNGNRLRSWLVSKRLVSTDDSFDGDADMILADLVDVAIKDLMNRPWVCRVPICGIEKH